MKEYDVVVIGAGIHGAGVAQAAAAAGYTVLVLEKNQVASGTSCKSSKLIHGGLRYLESFQFSLVRKSLKERDILCRIAEGLVKLQPFYIPVYKNTSRRPWKIRTGLSLYALLGGLARNTFFKRIQRKQLSKIDGLNTLELEKVYRYYDGQTDDKALTQAVMNSAIMLGAELDCNLTLSSINKNENSFDVFYQQYGDNKLAKSKLLVNAAGPWVNQVHEMVACKTNSLNIDLVQGTHIVVDIPSPSGIYYLEANDKRAVFVMPYKYNNEDLTLIGTTEKLFLGQPDEVTPGSEEIDYLLAVYNKYFSNKLSGDTAVLHSFAGLRVLPKTNGSIFSRPRDTILHWAAPRLLTLYGGKLTAYRSTAELAVKAIQKSLGKRQRLAYTDQLILEPRPLLKTAPSFDTDI